MEIRRCGLLAGVVDVMVAMSIFDFAFCFCFLFLVLVKSGKVG